MNNGQCASLDPWPSSNLLRDLVKAAGRAQIGHYSLVDKVIVSGTPRDSANLTLSDLVPSSAPLPRPAGIWSPICLFARRTSFRHGSLEMTPRIAVEDGRSTSTSQGVVKTLGNYSMAAGHTTNRAHVPTIQCFGGGTRMTLTGRRLVWMIVKHESCNTTPCVL
ncbi:uncharacterized protein SEPMUDRAFT_127256 [Sphaerulina musiva SO2202]|uniref:Uncharacterized protein n=1 Tax=Sphaerulina musiva (strain SO2202) TaxID=692275 RepID=N1QHE2_SPHMS|nr:uncharacterized protein SEPMUDRAFT_127256 [Sphaerulina musiva SO2202]EMF10568.1 hypothetical protein SEPMUDRAFT_127256 [Sphaerulina musiva SO2202]